GNGNAHCVRTSGTCGVAGRFDHVPAATGEDTDGDGEPDVVPAHVIAQTSCFPEGPHCTQEAHSWGMLNRETEHTKHEGSAHADCSGSWGSCSTIASVAYDPETGKVDAFARCSTGDSGGTRCTRSSTHTFAWAESVNGEDLEGEGVSDCNQSGGFCASSSLAKYFADGERTVTGENGEQVRLPAHVQSGAGCGTDGPAENCSYDYSAHGFEQLTEDDGLLAGDARGDCADSGTTGSGWCSVAADVTLELDQRTVEAVVWCQSGNARACSYSAPVTAQQDAGKNTADSQKSCGRQVAGSCALAVAAIAAGGDRDKQGQAVAFGFCADSNGTCTGEFSTHVDSNRDTLSDCRSSGAANGTCVGLAVPEHALSAGQLIDPEGDDRITLNSRAPGRDPETKVCSAAQRCEAQRIDEEAFEGLEGEFFVLDVHEDKSVGQWFKNFGRDLGDVVVYAIPGLLGSLGTELWNSVKYDFLGSDGFVGSLTGGHVGFDRPEQREGESDLEYYARLYPFTGGIAQGA